MEMGVLPCFRMVQTLSKDCVAGIVGHQFFGKGSVEASKTLNIIHCGASLPNSNCLHEGYPFSSLKKSTSDHHEPFIRFLEKFGEALIFVHVDNGMGQPNLADDVQIWFCGRVRAR